MQKIRNVATWIVMSLFAGLLLNNAVNVLAADPAATMFVLVCFGVCVAVFCQVVMWVSSLWAWLAVGEAWRLFRVMETRKELRRFR